MHKNKNNWKNHNVMEHVFHQSSCLFWSYQELIDNAYWQAGSYMFDMAKLLFKGGCRNIDKCHVKLEMKLDNVLKINNNDEN